MWAAVLENGDFLHCGSNNWETVEDRWVHGASGLASIIVFSFMQRFAWLPQGRPQGKQKNEKPGYVKMTIFLQLWFE